jgi:hypothetical protein
MKYERQRRGTTMHSFVPRFQRSFHMPFHPGLTAGPIYYRPFGPPGIELCCPIYSISVSNFGIRVYRNRWYFGRTIHEVFAAVVEPEMSTALRSVEFPSFLSNTPAESSRRAGHQRERHPEF